MWNKILSTLKKPGTGDGSTESILIIDVIHENLNNWVNLKKGNPLKT